MMDSGVVVQSGLRVVTIGLIRRAPHRLDPPPIRHSRRGPMVNIQDLFDDAKCYQTIRQMRWPDGVTCPRCSSASVIKNGRDDTEPHRQRYECKGCRQRFDDLTDTIFAGHHQPLRTWIACLYLMGLNLSGLQIAQELDIHKDDARAMISQLRQGIVERRPPVVLEGEVECKGPPNPFVQSATGCGPAFPGVGLGLPRQDG